MTSAELIDFVIISEESPLPLLPAGLDCEKSFKTEGSQLLHVFEFKNPVDSCCSLIRHITSSSLDRGLLPKITKKILIEHRHNRSLGIFEEIDVGHYYFVEVI